MTWKCPCGEENQDYEMRCRSCGVEFWEDDLDKLTTKWIVGQFNSRGEFAYRPEKIEPKYELHWNIRDRVGALIFGVLLAVFLIGAGIAELSPWQIDRETWKIFGYAVVFFGICGFLFRRKFFDLLVKVFSWFN